MKLTLKSGVEIGDGCKPFIIAEIGSNWSILEDCLYSIRVAKVCGASAVKFQLFTWKHLYGDLPVDKMFGISGALREDWLPKLKAQADEVGIEFMCSAFSPELVEAVDPFVNIHKVASAEMNHVRILEKLRHIGKPVILSTGASTAPDIKQALFYLNGMSSIVGDKVEIPCQVALMYCEGAYPAKNTLLSKMVLLKETFGQLALVGLSDHSLEVYAVPMQAIKLGACCIEKHVNFVDSKGPDAPHSLNQEEFTRMVKILSGEVTPVLGPSPDEQDMVTTHKRRLIAIRDILPGDILKEGENFGIFRSLKKDSRGLNPFAIDHVNGKTALVAINAGDGIGPCDI